MHLTHAQSSVRGLSVLVRLATAALIIGMLSIGQHVVVPIALAVILAFVLTAPVKALIKLGVHRFVAVGLVMVVAVGLIAGFGTFLSMQVNDLADKVSEYTESMRRRMIALELGPSGPFRKFEETFNTVTTGRDHIGPQIQTVRTLPAEVSAGSRLTESVRPFAAPLAAVAIVFVLTLFFLSHREDLRNRVIRLAGPRNVTLTTRTLDEAGHRISRYLGAQTVINASVGALIALGLYLIGVPYPILWGALAAVLRFVPYLGSWGAGLMPATLAFAIFPGWTQLFLVVLLFLVLDLVTGYFIEPVLIGHRTGVTAIALLVSTVFWSWLWGPIGLVLATPLTVSLAVLGRHLRSLRFLSVVLGDEEVLGPEVIYYQRLLAHEEDDASEVAQRLASTLAPLGVMDQVLLPAVLLAARDRDRREISDEDLAHLIEATRENVIQLRGETRNQRSNRLIGIATGAESELLLQMLSVALPGELGSIEVVSPPDNLGELGELVPAAVAVVLAALPPKGGTPARELCRRLKQHFPNLRVIVLRPDQTPEDAARAGARFRAAGADLVVATLAEAVEALANMALKLAA